jgi:hypothetical protein
MNGTLQYYLGSLATSEELSDQARNLRAILFSKPDLDDGSLFQEVKDFIGRQDEIHPDTSSILNIAIAPGYGSEYFGLGGADWNLKAEFLQALVTQFPAVISFKFKYADCACMAGKTPQVYYPILEAGMLMDTANKYYPSAELFEAIQESEYNFHFDLLLLDKYRQPCSRADFDDYVAELKEQYNRPEQLEQLTRLEWKGHKV